MITRRVVLSAAAGVAAAVGIPSSRWAAAAPGRAPSVPRTLALPRSLPDAGARVDRTTFAVSHLAVGWQGSGQPAVRVRSASGWGHWQPVHRCGAGKDGVAATARWALLTTPGAVGYEIAAGTGVAALSATEINTADGAARGSVAASPRALRLGGRTVPVPYLSRAGWGADESLRFDANGAEIWPPAYFPVQTLTVHHTATANRDPDPAATVRAIYYYHAITQGWGDIGYHLLIDEAGTVYEGRWSGTDPVPVFGPDPGPDGRPQMVNAGHVLGYNAGNIGVALLGDFTSQLPTRAARASLTLVLAALAGIEDIDPLGTVNYVNPISGATKTVDAISGHRDWLPTECPGNRFYPQLPSLRRDVARLPG